MKELEAWGSLFDRTKDGRILQRNFGGHRYPRLAHVGDRTGLEMIRTLQDHGIITGMRRYRCTILDLLTEAGRIVGALDTNLGAACSASSAPKLWCSRRTV